MLLAQSTYVVVFLMMPDCLKSNAQPGLVQSEDRKESSTWNSVSLLVLSIKMPDISSRDVLDPF